MFEKNLQVELNLKVQGKNFHIPSGSIKDFQFELFNHGFSAKIGFWISQRLSDDTLYSPFIEPDVIFASLSIQGYYNLPNPKPDPIYLQGIVIKRSFFEESYVDTKENKVFYRLYNIEFVDPARALWKQHYPCLLVAETTMQEVIKRQIVEGIALKFDWSVLEVKHPIVFLSLGDRKNRASFYDFLIWYVSTQNGVWNYDSKGNLYKLSATKDTTAKIYTLDGREVSSATLFQPETLRHNVKVLNAYTENAKTEEIKQTQSVTGIHNDYLARTSIASEFTARKSLESDRLKLRNHEVDIVFCDFPTITFRPGIFVRFDGEFWSKTFYLTGKEYRIHEVKMTAVAPDQNPQYTSDEVHCKYQIQMTAKVENKTEEFLHLPSFTVPHYPTHAEGKIVSEVDEDKDKTYQIYANPSNSIDSYKVHIPVWNQKIVIPFEPGLFPGHFYFPAYKYTRVLVALGLHEAYIKRFIEWGTNVRIPMDTQGNHLLLGKNILNQTSVMHTYTDGKPVLKIQRTNEADTQILQLEEGIMILEVKEEEPVVEEEETMSVVPRVDAAKSEITMETQASISGLTGDFSVIQSEMTGQIGDAVTEVSGSLESMDSNISSRITQAKSQIKSAMEELDQGLQSLKTSVSSMKSELNSAAKL